MEQKMCQEKQKFTGTRWSIFLFLQSTPEIQDYFWPVYWLNSLFALYLFFLTYRNNVALPFFYPPSVLSWSLLMLWRIVVFELKHTFLQTYIGMVAFFLTDLLQNLEKLWFSLHKTKFERKNESRLYYWIKLADFGCAVLNDFSL